MRKIVRGILIILFSGLCLGIMGCATGPDTQAIMNSWMGHHKSEIIQAWGPPSSYTSDGKDGEVLIYENTKNVMMPVSGMVVSRNITDYTQVYVTKEGKIYYIRWGRQ